MYAQIAEIILFWLGIALLSLLWRWVASTCGFKPRQKPKRKHMTEQDYRDLQAWVQ